MKALFARLAGPLITLNPAEHSEYRWLVRAVAATQVTSYTNREAILRLP